MKYYAVQCYYDGFGNDTMTCTCCLTKEECKQWIENNIEDMTENWGFVPQFEIVEQIFGEWYENAF